MKQNVQVSLMSVAVAAALSVMASGAVADPLSLRLSQSIAHDSNVTNTTARVADWISQTDVTVALEKPYGRQNYSGSARFGSTRFAHNGDKYNNQNYDVAGGFSTGIASNWQVSTNVSASENLGTPQAAVSDEERLKKNIVRGRDGSLDVQYGVDGRWAVVGSASVASSDNSLASQKYANLDQSSSGFRLTYSPSDLLLFGVGGSHTRSDYKDNIILGGVPQRYINNSLNLSSVWQVTGYSSVNGVLSFSDSEYRSRPGVSFKNVSGRANWNFTPRGLTTYALSFNRAAGGDLSNKEKGLDNVVRDTSVDNMTTTLQGSLSWKATSKVVFGSVLGWTRYDRVKTIEGASETKDASNFTTASLTGSYNYSRAVGMLCSAKNSKQTEGAARNEFGGRRYSCQATFTID